MYCNQTEAANMEQTDLSSRLTINPMFSFPKNENVESGIVNLIEAAELLRRNKIETSESYSDLIVLTSPQSIHVVVKSCTDIDADRIGNGTCDLLDVSHISVSDQSIDSSEEINLVFNDGVCMW